MTQFNVDFVLGRQVLTQDGKPLGRIEAIHVRRDGDAWLISEYHIGPDAWLERLAIGVLPRLLREAVQRRSRSRRHRIAWHQIDLTDPRHPRLVCDQAELRSSAHDMEIECEAPLTPGRNDRSGAE
jgi:hypothetical protein